MEGQGVETFSSKVEGSLLHEKKIHNPFDEGIDED